MPSAGSATAASRTWTEAELEYTCAIYLAEPERGGTSGYRVIIAELSLIQPLKAILAKNHSNTWRTI